MSTERLDKILADTGEMSRKEAKAIVRQGRVSVNGAAVVDPDAKFDTAAIEIKVDGREIDYKKFRYIILHKPAGVLSATEDGKQQTVIDLLPKALRAQELFPVGRLDKDTTGLLLLTNDGDFSHRITSPKHHVSKVYRATVDGILANDDILAFEKGIVLFDDLRCLPAKLEIIAPDTGLVTVFEGKYHQVKRMFAARGKYVTALHRLSIGGLRLDEKLVPGEFRELSADELQCIFDK